MRASGVGVGVGASVAVGVGSNGVGTTVGVGVESEGRFRLKIGKLQLERSNARMMAICHIERVLIMKTLYCGFL